ncbi:MAG: enolase C-terminal domain-like protein, partial [Verrucomicrobiota bacterium]|nr:enolase C-terminal domain-like protein [Verrucomicrobiota bacterium]
ESFKHSSYKRSETETILTVVKSKDIAGHGEGCPRKYVTNETIKSSLLFLNENKTNWLKLNNLEDLANWVALNRTLVDKNPAAFCSFELALLDLIGRTSKKSAESVVGLKELDGNYGYTAVLGILNQEQFSSQVQRYSKIGFTDFKIKLSGEFQLDKDNISQLNTTITNSRIRLDANNLWMDWSSAADYIKRLKFDFLGVEEPLAHGDFKGMKKFSGSTNIPIILDESFLRYEHFSQIESSPKNWLINLRISKMGGILRSIEIANQAENLGLPLIIGAQVGETSILSRAALSIANHYRDLVAGQEGAFGTYLLEKDITEDPIMFGKGGVLESSSITTNSYGWGMNVRALE